MITQTKEKILAFIRQKGQARVHDLVREFKISHVAVHKQVKRLLSDNLIEKRGTPPTVFYVPMKIENEVEETYEITREERSYIENNFLSITPDGKVLNGMKGFVYWASIYGRNKTIPDLSREYMKNMMERIKNETKDGLVDATNKLTSTFPNTPIKHLFYADIYSIPVFGRTKLAKLVMHAKGAQDKKLIEEIADIVRNKIANLIKSYSIQAVAYIPPTVPRPMQFVWELADSLHLPLPLIEITKIVPGNVPVAQKSLTTTAERVINARESMYPKAIAGLPYKNILLIDDVAGSGASFNEVASKIAPLCEKNTNIIAFSIVGNQKGYDVIRQI